MGNKIFYLVFFLFVASLSFSQTTISTDIEDRYIVIENFENFFTKNAEGFMESIPFWLCNIKEDESSKPAYVLVNEMQKVKKFYLRSSSDEFETKRWSKIVLNSDSYKETFCTALHNMGVKYIFLNSEQLTINEFYNKIK